MKKILLGIAAFSLMLTSCQKSEIVERVSDGDNQLKFGVYQGKATKTGELTNDDLLQNGVNFPLYAYRGAQADTKTSYFSEVLTYGNPNADQWNTTIPRFLPDVDPLQLYAYYAQGGTTSGVIPGATYKAPANLTSDAKGSDAYPTLEYAIQDIQADLVAASVNDNKGASITIPFKHILSQINFGVKGYYGAKIKISNIVVHQVNNSGTFSFNPDPTAWGWTSQSTLADYTYTFPEFKTPGGVETSGKWEDTNAEGDNRYIFGDGGKWGPGLTDDIWYVTENSTPIKGTDITPTGPTATPKLQNSLILMPQALTANMTQAYVTFDYTIQDLEDNYIIDNATTGVEGKFDLNMGDDTGAYADTWKPNLRYLYIIDFTKYLNGQQLSFDVDVDTNEWENYNNEGNNDGIVLLASTGQPVFIKSVKNIAVGGNIDIEKGNVFTDITWDWSANTMGSQFTTAGESFTIKFANVTFNGNSITIIPPVGFSVDNNGKASSKTDVLTFTKL